MANKRNIDVRLNFQSTGQKGVEASVISLGKKLLGVASAVAIAGKAIQSVNQFVSESVTISKSFEVGLQNVNTLLGAQGDRILPSLTNGLKGLSQEFGLGLMPAVEGLYDAISADLPAENVMEFLRQGSQAAVAGVSDLKTIINASTTVLSAFGLGLEDNADVLDLFFGIIEKGKITMSELSTTIGRSAAGAAIIKLRFGEWGGAVATLTKQVDEKSRVQTELNRLLSVFTSELTPKQLEASKLLGVEINLEAIRTKGLVGVIGELVGAKPELLKQLFSEEQAFRAVSELIGDYNSLVTNTAAIDNRAGKTLAAFNKQKNTAIFIDKQMKASLEVLQLTLGNGLTPTLTKTKKELIPLVQKFSSFIGMMNLAIQKVKEGSDKTSFLALMMNILKNTVANLLGPIKNLGVVFTILVNLAKQLWESFEVLGQVILDSLEKPFNIIIDKIKSFSKIMGVVLPNTFKKSKGAMLDGLPNEKEVKGKLDPIKKYLKDTYLKKINFGFSDALKAEYQKSEEITLEWLKAQRDANKKSDQQLAEEKAITLSRRTKQDADFLALQTKKEQAAAEEQFSRLRDLERQKQKFALDGQQITLKQYKAFLMKQITALDNFGILSVEQELERLDIMKELRDTEEVEVITGLERLQQGHVDSANSIRAINEAMLSSMTASFKMAFKNMGNIGKAFEDTMKTTIMTIADIWINEMAKMVTDFIKGKEKMTIATRVWQGIEILASAAVAAAKAAASAFAVVPFPFNIIAAAAAAAAAYGLVTSFLATGDRGNEGGLSVVGEKGPELINIPSGSHVLNNQETRNIMNSTNNSTNRGITINNVFSNNSFIGEEDFIEQIEDTIFQNLQAIQNV